MPMLRAADAAPPLAGAANSTAARDLGGPEPEAESRSPVTIGYLRDSAFSFYYPENLEALEERGAPRWCRSPSLDRRPAAARTLHALYIGGGFPETHARGPRRQPPAARLDPRDAAASGLPIYAECGGLMLLARSVTWRGRRHAMAGVLPVDVEVFDAPQGHGYMALSVDRPNPFFAARAGVSGARVPLLPHRRRRCRATACAVVRGTGCGGGPRRACASTGLGELRARPRVGPAGRGPMASSPRRAGTGLRPRRWPTAASRMEGCQSWLHPIFIDLTGQPVVVVGGGNGGRAQDRDAARRRARASRSSAPR